MCKMCKNFRFSAKNSTYRDCRGRPRNKGHHDARRSPRVARQEANSTPCEDTIYLKHYFFILKLLYNYEKLSFSVAYAFINMFVRGTLVLETHIIYFVLLGKKINVKEKNVFINLHTQIRQHTVDTLNVLRQNKVLVSQRFEL